jgi:hypothetical protein
MIGARASRTKKQRGGNQRRPLSSFPSLLSLSPFNHEKEAKIVCAKRALFMCALAGQATKNLRIDKTQFLHHEKVFRVSVIFFLRLANSPSREREREITKGGAATTTNRRRIDDDNNGGNETRFVALQLFFSFFSLVVVFVREKEQQ